MAGHTSEKRWTRKTINERVFEGVSERARSVLGSPIDKLNEAEEAYQQMQEIYSYAGGTATDLANLLFKEEIEGRGDSVANQEEVDKATDIVGAMTAAHQVYQAADNIVVAQSDRFSDMRRMV